MRITRWLLIDNSITNTRKYRYDSSETYNIKYIKLYVRSSTNNN